MASTSMTTLLLALAGLNATIEALHTASVDVGAAILEVKEQLVLINQKLGAGLPESLDNGRLRVKSGGN